MDDVYVKITIMMIIRIINANNALHFGYIIIKYNKAIIKIFKFNLLL